MSGFNEKRGNQETLLDVQHLQVYFPIRSGLMRRVTGHVHAVEDVSFSVRPREVFALVGESGCGKSTTGSAILRLIEPTGGTVRFKGEELGQLTEEEMRLRRRDMQFIFQNPYASLNPRMNVWKLLSEPLRVHFQLSEAETREKVEDMLRLIGMTPDQLERYPHQFSGGQKQRISIARALITHPSFVVADEPVSALDVSIQAQILNLMMELQQEMQLSMIRGGHVPGLHHGAGRHRGGIYPPGPPLCPGPAERRALPRPAAPVPAHRAGRRRPQPGLPALRLPRPHPLQPVQENL